MLNLVKIVSNDKSKVCFLAGWYKEWPLSKVFPEIRKGLIVDQEKVQLAITQRHETMN